MTKHHVRFAPSPTGDLHLGHLYSALYAWQRAGRDPVHFQLRIDDLDHTRCRDIFINRHCDDLQWFGLSWQKPPLKQSLRLHRYQHALSYLQEKGVVYPCYLSRKEVNELLSAPQQTTDTKSGSVLKNAQTEEKQNSGTEPAWRLDIAKIKKQTGTLYWHDAQKGRCEVDLDRLSDSVIARRDIGTSYDLSVVLDDYDSGITLVTRGEDLYEQTNIHRLLQHLLQLPTPLYDHHRLITDKDGKRLAKRDDARSIAAYREQGFSADDITGFLPEIP